MANDYSKYLSAHKMVVINHIQFEDDMVHGRVAMTPEAANYICENEVNIEMLVKMVGVFLPFGVPLIIPDNDKCETIFNFMTICSDRAYALSDISKGNPRTILEIVTQYGAPELSPDMLSNFLMQLDNLEIFDEYPYDDYNEWLEGIAEDNDLYQLKDGRYLNLATLPDLNAYSTKDIIKEHADIIKEVYKHAIKELLDNTPSLINHAQDLSETAETLNQESEYFHTTQEQVR